LSDFVLLSAPKVTLVAARRQESVTAMVERVRWVMGAPLYE
jgi:hypothetical protein